MREFDSGSDIKGSTLYTNPVCAVRFSHRPFAVQAQKLEPTLATWRGMVDVWSSEETSDEARLDRIFGSLQRRNWKPVREVQLHAAIAYAHSKAWHKAMVWFDLAVSGCTINLFLELVVKPLLDGISGWCFG